MAQPMPLPLTVSCFSKIQIGFTFLVPAHRVVPDKGPLNSPNYLLTKQHKSTGKDDAHKAKQLQFATTYD